MGRGGGGELGEQEERDLVAEHLHLGTDYQDFRFAVLEVGDVLGLVVLCAPVVGRAVLAVLDVYFVVVYF